MADDELDAELFAGEADDGLREIARDLLVKLMLAEWLDQKTPDEIEDIRLGLRAAFRAELSVEDAVAVRFDACLDAELSGFGSGPSVPDDVADRD